jgi:hypothetical protein
MLASFPAFPAFAQEPTKASASQGESPKQSRNGLGAAEPPNAVQGETAVPARHWYGAQTLLVDGAALALVVSGVLIHPPAQTDPNCDSRCANPAATARDTLLAVGISGYALGSPIVHITHDHAGKAGASFGLRLIPTLLMLAGLTTCQSQGCGVAMVPGFVTATVVTLVDGAVIAREDVRPEPTTIRVAPWMDPTTRRAGFAIGGAF